MSLNAKKKCLLKNGEKIWLRRFQLSCTGCDLVLEFEILALMFVRACRSNDFNLFVEPLDALVPRFFFVLDHVNYSCWIPIHVRDMISLPNAVKGDLVVLGPSNDKSRVFLH